LKVVPLDTGDSNSIKQLTQLVETQYNQQIDLLVNNAGILTPGVWDQPIFDQTVKVNVVGPVQLSQALLPLLSPGALIVMVSSGLGAQANISPEYQQAIQAVTDVTALPAAVPFKASSPMGSSPPGQGGMSPTYSVSKAMLNRAVQLLSDDSAFQSKDVSVVSTCPGWCRTDMGTAAADRSAEQGAASVLWPFFNWEKSLAGSFTRDGSRQQW
jgi:NAD(P)-dependent dehydrogenase (short-subunit alcohol dehydrogenase family)